MKTNLEKEIKDQLSNRKLPPSEQAWMQVEAELNQKPARQSGWRNLWISIPIAASFVLFLVWMKQNDTAHDQPTPTAATSVQKQEILSPAAPLVIVDHKTNRVENKKLPTPQPPENNTKTEVVVSPAVAIPQSDPSWTTKNTVAPTPDKMMAKNPDSIGKKTRYVDPQMLLFSVEHDQAVKKRNSKKGTLVIIDFNKEN